MTKTEAIKLLKGYRPILLPEKDLKEYDLAVEIVAEEEKVRLP